MNPWTMAASSAEEFPAQSPLLSRGIRRRDSRSLLRIINGLRPSSDIPSKYIILFICVLAMYGRFDAASGWCRELSGREDVGREILPQALLWTLPYPYSYSMGNIAEDVPVLNLIGCVDILSDQFDEGAEVPALLECVCKILALYGSNVELKRIVALLARRRYTSCVDIIEYVISKADLATAFDMCLILARSSRTLPAFLARNVCRLAFKLLGGGKIEGSESEIRSIGVILHFSLDERERAWALSRLNILLQDARHASIAIHGSRSACATLMLAFEQSLITATEIGDIVLRSAELERDASPLLRHFLSAAVSNDEIEVLFVGLRVIENATALLLIVASLCAKDVGNTQILEVGMVLAEAVQKKMRARGAHFDRADELFSGCFALTIWSVVTGSPRATVVHRFTREMWAEARQLRSVGSAFDALDLAAKVIILQPDHKFAIILLTSFGRDARYLSLLPYHFRVIGRSISGEDEYLVNSLKALGRSSISSLAIPSSIILSEKHVAVDEFWTEFIREGLESGRQT